MVDERLRRLNLLNCTAGKKSKKLKLEPQDLAAEYKRYPWDDMVRQDTLKERKVVELQVGGWQPLPSCVVAAGEGAGPVPAQGMTAGRMGYGVALLRLVYTKHTRSFNPPWRPPGVPALPPASGQRDQEYSHRPHQGPQGCGRWAPGARLSSGTSR